MKITITKMKILAILIFVAAVIAAPCHSYAGESVPKPAFGVDISSSPMPVGSGARALGMGGAFIAIADHSRQTGI